MRRTASLFLALVLAAPSAAQQPARAPTAYDRAIAAGYKALTLCSAMFNGAGRTQAQVEALELTGIYPEYDAIVPTLTAEVDAQRQRVRVTFDPAMPPRLASFRSGGGCTVEPIGATAATRRDESPAPGAAPSRWMRP